MHAINSLNSDPGVCSDGSRVGESSATLSCTNYCCRWAASADVVTSCSVSAGTAQALHRGGSLCDYLQEQFPEVDPAFRSVIGSAAAQYMLLCTQNLFVQTASPRITRKETLQLKLEGCCHFGSTCSSTWHAVRVVGSITDSDGI